MPSLIRSTGRGGRWYSSNGTIFGANFLHDIQRLYAHGRLSGPSQVKKKGAEKPKEYAELQAKYAKMQEMDMARLVSPTFFINVYLVPIVF